MPPVPGPGDPPVTAMATLPAVALPSGPAYTVVLLCHVAAVLVGMVTMVAGVAFALRLLLSGHRPVPASVRSYFSPGTNWAGRALYLVPVFGAALLALSGGAYRFGSAWVLAGVGLWAAAVALAELVLWPAEQRIRRALSPVPVGAGGRAGAGTEVDGAAPVGAVLGADPGAAAPGAATRPQAPEEARRGARTLCLSSMAVLALLVAGMVVMFAKP